MSALMGEDRGFTLGDGLFETVLARNGALALWDDHMARLRRGCLTLGLPEPDLAACREAAVGALADAGLTARRAAVRLSWSAGMGGRGLDRPSTLSPALVVTAAPSPLPSGPLSLHSVSVRRNEGSPASRLKTLAYVDNVLARREARAAGAEEALMLNVGGQLACAAAGNLFWITGGRLMTPAVECGVLDGVVRAVLMARAQASGWSVETVRLGREALEAAEAVFVTNSLSGVRQVMRLDARNFDQHPAGMTLTGLVPEAR